MALLSVANLVFSHGDHRVLDGVNLTLAPGEHVGMVGRNGCGKSSLMKLIAGLGGHKPDSGQIQLARGASVGYLSQHHDLNPEHTLREEAGEAFAELTALHHKLEKITNEMAEADGEQLEKLLKQYERVEHEMQAAGGYAVDHKIEEALHGLGLTNEFFNVKVKDLSGGQKGRLALAKLLLSEPDLLMLDEPTNHLDIAGREWLELFLKEYRGAVLLVSHDRWLLDRVVSCIYEIEIGQMVRFPGNYEKYIELRAERREAQQRVYDKQQTKIRQEQAFIDRYKAGQRAKQAQGRQKRLERFIRDETMDAPIDLDSMNLRFSPATRSGEIVLQCEKLTKQYDDKVLFNDFSYTVKRGAKIGIVGPNGAGKTTFIRCLTGEMDADHGSSRIGSQVSIGYFRQTQEHLDQSQTVVQFLQRFTQNNLEQEARDLAGAFLFSGLEQDKPLSVLSGGERARAVLASLITGGHNLLVLDEPSNHLDIPSSERLEEAIKQYTKVNKSYGQNTKVGGGTLVLITHDRMLLEHTVDELLIFDGEGNVEHLPGTWSDYAALRAQREAAQQEKRETELLAQREKEQRAKQQEEKRQKQNKGSDTKGGREKKKKTRYAAMSQSKLELRIEELETQLKAMDDQLADPNLYRDHKKFHTLQDEREKVAAELEPLEEEWVMRAETA